MRSIALAVRAEAQTWMLEKERIVRQRRVGAGVARQHDFATDSPPATD